jgi:hypothetical protein
LEIKAEAVKSILELGCRAEVLCFSLGPTSQVPPVPKQVKARCRDLGFEIQIDHYTSQNVS